MRRAVLVGLLLLAAGCRPYQVPPGVALPGIGVLVQGAAGRCVPVAAGGHVHRVCLPPPDSAEAPADSALVDTVATAR